MEESFVGDAEGFGGAGFVPLGLAKGFGNFEFFDVIDGALGDFFERAFPAEIFGEHVGGEFVLGGARSGELEGGGVDFFAGGEDCGAFDGVLEFANITWPGVAFDEAARGGAELEIRFAEFAAEFFKKIFSEEDGVAFTFAKGRNSDGDGGDAEVKIFAELFFADGSLKIAIGSGDEADIDFDGSGAADAIEAFFFEDAEKFGLNGDRQVANFVEEESAAVSEFDFADFASAGAGEGTAFVAEKLVFNQAFGNGGAI